MEGGEDRVENWSKEDFVPLLLFQEVHLCSGRVVGGIQLVTGGGWVR